MSPFRKLCPTSPRLLIPASLLFLIGCGDGVDPGRGVPVSGMITMDGVPLEGANVTFMNGTFAGYARTDAEGKYRLVQGALPGTNKIVISKIEGGAEPVVNDPESGMDAGQMEAAAMGTGVEPELPKNLVPAEYGDPAQTKLTFDVPGAGASDVNFSI